MIITVLGASAQSTPELADTLAREVSSPTVLRLAGRTAERLFGVARACHILCKGSQVSVEPYGMDRWCEAIAGSDAIILQIRVGGYEGRAFDERFPLESGVPGDEGLGPGGLSSAYRSWPELARWFEWIRLLAPHSKVVLLTSPGGLLVRLAATTFPELDVVHVCELPATTLRELCNAVGEPVDALSFDFVGVNHLGWLFNVRSHGVDLLERYVALQERARFPDASLVAAVRAYPVKYLRLHYYREQSVASQSNQSRSRAEQLTRIAAGSFESFRNGGARAIRAALTARRARWYTEAVVPLLRAWMGDPVTHPLFLTDASRAPDVAERYYRAVGGRVDEVPAGAAPPDPVASLLEALKGYERTAASAVLDGSELALTEALAVHPWVTAPKRASRMARQIIEYAHQAGLRPVGVSHG